MELNDHTKLLRLYELYEQPMYRIAFAVLHDSALAEDAVHDAFVRIIGKLKKLGAPDSLKTKAYIVKTVQSTSITIYRRNRRRSEYEQPMDRDTLFAAAPDTAFSGTDELLSSISDTDRRIVILRCIKGMSWKEVASEMSLKEATVRKRFERAKTSLKKAKGDHYDET